MGVTTFKQSLILASLALAGVRAELVRTICILTDDAATLTSGFKFLGKLVPKFLHV